jgi:hypothetical protein
MASLVGLSFCRLLRREKKELAMLVKHYIPTMTALMSSLVSTDRIVDVVYSGVTQSQSHSLCRKLILKVTWWDSSQIIDECGIFFWLFGWNSVSFTWKDKNTVAAVMGSIAIRRLASRTISASGMIVNLFLMRV